MTSLVRSMQEFPVPTDATELKRFVHMAGWYRRFLSDFASKAAPMTRLLRKGVIWRWATPQRQRLLVYPDFPKLFRLVTDASTTGLGAVLTKDQGQGAQENPHTPSVVNNLHMGGYSLVRNACIGGAEHD
ncbi:unnamed protein product [Phytophthora fragariaefolia]|uniref:Unnamed protein product n=1 Tax=Phytophthora fragariaefolia TaxID=1490495 RepID=A0A9W6XW88_9STRA|nr:unnamed protein product [Phytophthora fragariaefolia]